MTRCSDCGTKLTNGICPNCEEELYINDYQLPDDPVEVGPEWKRRVKEQRAKVKARKAERPKGDSNG